MRRNDRRKPSDDNAVNYPTSPKKEQISYEDLKKRLATVQSLKGDVELERDGLKQEVKETIQQVQEVRLAYSEVHDKYQSTLTLYNNAETQYKSTIVLYDEEKQKRQLTIKALQAEEVRSSELTIQLNEVGTQYKSALARYVEEQQKGKTIVEELEATKIQAQSYFKLSQESQTQAQSYLTMYETEKVRGDELTIQLNEVTGYRDRYLVLYNESQAELKTERRSKAGVKGWETRRKKENEKLKQEISEMAMVLRDSMERKDEAINSLYAVAERMDRIQRMVDSVEGDDTANNPIGMMQKLQRMWQAVKEILAE